MPSLIAGPPAQACLPDLGEEQTGVRDYPERAAVIRSSQRALLSGICSLLLPPISWALVANTQSEIRFTSTRSLDPLGSQLRWPWHLALGSGVALGTAMFGGILAITTLMMLSATEVVLVFRLYNHRKPCRWNPARSRLYIGAACAGCARIQMFALMGLTMLFLGRLLVFK